jgi:hypothetical protein
MLPAPTRWSARRSAAWIALFLTLVSVTVLLVRQSDRDSQLCQKQDARVRAIVEKVESEGMVYEREMDGGWDLVYRGKSYGKHRLGGVTDELYALGPSYTAAVLRCARGCAGPQRFSCIRCLEKRLDLPTGMGVAGIMYDDMMCREYLDRCTSVWTMAEAYLREVGVRVK